MVTARLWRRIDVRSPLECWTWEGTTESNGYGRIKISGGKMKSAHRAVWEDFYGAIPAGLCVLHRCDNPPCCNPFHMSLGTNDQNMADMVAKGRATRGERNGAAKLTEAAVRAIRCSSRSRDELATEYGVTKENIGLIQRHQSWRHVGLVDA